MNKNLRESLHVLLFAILINSQTQCHKPTRFCNPFGGHHEPSSQKGLQKRPKRGLLKSSKRRSRLGLSIMAAKKLKSKVVSGIFFSNKSFLREIPSRKHFWFQQSIHQWENQDILRSREHRIQYNWFNEFKIQICLCQVISINILVITKTRWSCFESPWKIAMKNSQKNSHGVSLYRPLCFCCFFRPKTWNISQISYTWVSYRPRWSDVNPHYFITNPHYGLHMLAAYQMEPTNPLPPTRRTSRLNPTCIHPTIGPTMGASWYLFDKTIIKHHQTKPFMNPCHLQSSPKITPWILTIHRLISTKPQSSQKQPVINQLHTNFIPLPTYLAHPWPIMAPQHPPPSTNFLPNDMSQFGQNRGVWYTIYHHLPVVIRGSFNPLY